MSALEWLSYRLANACVGLSPSIRDGIARRSHKDKRIAMIPNGCDVDVFRPGERGNLDVDKINDNDLVAVFTGAHGIANELDALLDAAHELLQ